MAKRLGNILLVTTAAIAAAAALAALWEAPAHAQRPPVPGPFGQRQMLNPRPIGPVAPPVPPSGPSYMGGPAGPQGPAGAESPGEPGEAEFNKCLKVPAAQKVLSTLKPDSDLADLVQFVESFTCKRFVYSSAVRSTKVTVWMPEEVTPAEAYHIFLSALEAMHLTVVPDGPVLKIVETMEAKEEGLPIYSSGEPVPSTDAMVTRLFRLEHATTEELVPVLGTLKSKDGIITAYAPTNAIIVTDTGTNINTMGQLIHQLDVGGQGDQIFLIHLQNASAEQVKARLDEVFSKLGQRLPSGGVRYAPQGGPPPANVEGMNAPGSPSGESSISAGELHVTAIVAEPRTNSLIIVATQRSYLEVLALVQKLDVPIAGAENLLHVYTLENADATLLAQTLQGIVGGAGAAPPSSPQGGPAAPARAFEGAVRVQPDKSTNSLVIQADLKDYLELSDVIRQLDQPRRQVFVEAAILEVSLDRDRKLGMSFHAGDPVQAPVGPPGQSLAYGASENIPGMSSFSIPIGSLSGLVAGLLGPAIPNAATLLGLPPGTSIPSFGVLLQAIQTNNDVNVLSTPHILTTDNEKAEISVGQNVPYASTTFPGLSGGLPGGTTPGSTGSTGVSPFGFLGATVQRMDVALKLDLTPHINQGDYVRLEVDLEISDIFAQNYNGVGPATNKRVAKTVVVVKDQQTAVLGGLMSDKTTETETKVPLLGDIPIIGFLFRYNEKQSAKTDLIIFLTPYIIRDPSDLRRIFERKIEERRQFLERNTVFQSTLDFEANVDYRRKRGLIDEIDAAAQEADVEREQYEEVRRPRGVAQDLGEITPDSAITRQSPSSAPASGPVAVPPVVNPPTSRPTP